MGTFMEEAAARKKARAAEEAAKNTPEALAARKARIKSVDDHLKASKKKAEKVSTVAKAKVSSTPGSWRR